MIIAAVSCLLNLTDLAIYWLIHAKILLLLFFNNRLQKLKVFPEVPLVF